MDGRHDTTSMADFSASKEQAVVFPLLVPPEYIEGAQAARYTSGVPACDVLEEHLRDVSYTAELLAQSLLEVAVGVASGTTRQDQTDDVRQGFRAGGGCGTSVVHQ